MGRLRQDVGRESGCLGKRMEKRVLGYSRSPRLRLDRLI